MITVLGKTFNTEEERLEYFQNELRKKLPALKQLDGFPIGEDEDIINLSDPPYYTACPNPWLNDFIEEWEQEKANISNRDPYFQQLEPYAADVSEGKSEPIYNAHSYHTKVPHKAIMRYILHYTQPGDIIYDAFSGSGMTGIAASKCSDFYELISLGLIVNNNNEIIKSSKIMGFSGTRNAILSDLSPAATHLTYNNNNFVDTDKFKKLAEEIIYEAKNKFGWMFTTEDPVTKKEVEVEYFVWSEISTCEECSNNLNFSEIAFSNDLKELKKEIFCPECGIQINKEKLKPQYSSEYDNLIDEVIQIPNRELILICFKRNKRKEYKKPDKEDLVKIENIKQLSKPNIPTKKIPDMQMMRVGRMKPSKIQYTHQFYFERMKHILSYLWEKAEKIESKKEKELIKYWLDSHFVNLSYRNRYRPDVSFPYNPMTGVFYIPMMSSEANPFIAYGNKIERIIKAFKSKKFNEEKVVTSTNSASKTTINNNCIDYIFTDPPFGENIYYSDLNFYIEAWQKVFTNSKLEAIVDKVKNKDEFEYNKLITNCFQEYYRVLKPGKWMTVVFSNTKASIWNGIQLAINNSGFIISNVSALDKQQGTFQAVNTTTAVKQDLVISCYKPSEEFLNKFETEKTEQVGVWDFVIEHLHHLPVHLSKENSTTAVVERSPKIIYDRLISFYLMRDLQVPLDARAFQEGLKQRFIERDGMYFTPEQVVEYDQKKAKTPNFTQLALIVTTENEGIEWLRAKLNEQSMSYQDLQPNWMQAITAIQKGNILPELRNILQENFIQEADGNWRVPDMNEQKDRDALRNKALLKEFAKYVEEIDKPKGKLKEVRVEALRAGFEHCRQQKAYDVLIKVAERMPQNILLEDEFLLMYYDNAKDKV